MLLVRIEAELIGHMAGHMTVKTMKQVYKRIMRSFGAVTDETLVLIKA